MGKESLADHLIEQYRELVGNRYQYDHLDSLFILDDIVTPELVNEVRSYFLEYIYPSADKREILNNAFNNMDKHFKNPKQMLKLVGDASGIMLKFGFQFPKAIKAGMNSLKSFNAAAKFEKGLLKAAEKSELDVPLTADEFLGVIASLPEKQVRGFINDFDTLLEGLTDDKLLKKTIDIMEELVKQMKLRPDIYSETDIEGIGMGREILNNGYQLFSGMNKDEKKEMIELIIRTENHFLDEIYGS